MTNELREQNASESVTYMLGWGEHYERRSSGPYLGAAGLDFSALVEDYRLDRYAEANAAKEDFCALYESEFADWLVKKGILVPVESIEVEVNIHTSSEDAYVPLHWPECPECQEGRGEQEYGVVRRSLNRVTAFRRCTECRHEWGQAEVPNDASRPMLDDDGRDTPGACVPFAISKACGIGFPDVLKVCEKHGWSATGMNQSKAVVAARELGFDLVRMARYGVGSVTPPTLKRLLGELPANRNYVVGVKGHWLALVRGQIVDNETNSTPARKVLELYEVQSAA